MFKTLPDEFKRGPHTFKVIKREGNVALVSQSNEEGRVICFEVVLITNQKEGEFRDKNNVVLYKMEAKEVYPSDEKIGHGYGKSFANNELCTKRRDNYFKELVAKDKAKQSAAESDNAIESSDTSEPNQVKQSKPGKSIKDSNVSWPETEFTIKEYETLSGKSYALCYLDIKEAVGNNLIKVIRVDKEIGKRGKGRNVYLKV